MITWRRAHIAGAGIAIDQHPDWATLDGERLVYQRFSDEGAVSVRWGADSTIDEILAHVGLGGGGTRTIEADESATVAGVPARRVRLRVDPSGAVSHELPPETARIFVFVGFAVDGTPVLVGYRAPEDELPEYEPLLEHILASVGGIP